EYLRFQTRVDAHAYRRGQPCRPALGAGGRWVARRPAAHLRAPRILSHAGARLDFCSGHRYWHSGWSGLKCGVLLDLQPPGLSLAVAVDRLCGLAGLRRLDLAAPACGAAGRPTVSRRVGPVGRRALPHAALHRNWRERSRPLVGHPGAYGGSDWYRAAADDAGARTWAAFEWPPCSLSPLRHNPGRLHSCTARSSLCGAAHAWRRAGNVCLRGVFPGCGRPHRARRPRRHVCPGNPRRAGRAGGDAPAAQPHPLRPRNIPEYPGISRTAALSHRARHFRAATAPTLRTRRQEVVGEGCGVGGLPRDGVAGTIIDGVVIEHEARIVGPLLQCLDTPAPGVGDILRTLPVLTVMDKAGVVEQITRLRPCPQQV